MGIFDKYNAKRNPQNEFPFFSAIDELLNGVIADQLKVKYLEFDNKSDKLIQRKFETLDALGERVERKGDIFDKVTLSKKELDVILTEYLRVSIADDILNQIRDEVKANKEESKKATNKIDSEASARFKDIESAVARYQKELDGRITTVKNLIPKAVDVSGFIKMDKLEKLKTELQEAFKKEIDNKLKNIKPGTASGIRTGGSGYAQILDDGTKVRRKSAINFHGDGVTITENENYTDIEISGGSAQGFTAVAKAASFDVAHANSFSRYLVTGAMTATLQVDIVAGDEFIFMVRSDALLTIQLGAGQVVAISPTTISSTAGTIFASKKYALIHLYAISATELQAQSTIGTWGKT